jgi:hypothetical protein
MEKCEKFFSRFFKKKNFKFFKFFFFTDFNTDHTQRANEAPRRGVIREYVIIAVTMCNFDDLQTPFFHQKEKILGKIPILLR